MFCAFKDSKIRIFPPKYETLSIFGTGSFNKINLSSLIIIGHITQYTQLEHAAIPLIVMQLNLFGHSILLNLFPFNYLIST